MFDPGSTGFMILGAMLVFLMTPALAFFYGGLSRRKNVLNTMFMSIAVIGFVGVLWIVAGWSFAYGGDGSCPFFGGFDQIFCVGLLECWRAIGSCVRAHGIARLCECLQRPRFVLVAL